MSTSQPSRRQVLTGLGAVSAGIVGSQLVPGSAGAADPLGDGPTTRGAAASTEAVAFTTTVAPTTPGMRYTSVSGIDFDAGNNTLTYSSGSGELASTGGGFFTYNVDLPAGSVIREVVMYFTKPVASNITLRLVKSIGAPGEDLFDELFNHTTAAAPVSATPQTAIATPDFSAGTPEQQAALLEMATVDPTTGTHFVILNMPGAPTVNVRQVRIGYTTVEKSFVPLTPGRVYDSRWAVFGGAKLTTGENKVVSVRDRRSTNPDDGSVNLADFVPAGAAAISFNLGVADTTAQGFLAVVPGTDTTFGAASINWFGTGQILNNGTVTTIDADRQVKVFVGGGGAAHVIIDVTGYYI